MPLHPHPPFRNSIFGFLSTFEFRGFGFPPLLLAFALAATADLADFQLPQTLTQLLNESTVTRAMDKVHEADELRNAGRLEQAVAASAEAVAFAPEMPM
ncbi:MAG: hypothetical protein HZA91_08435, partial [Verrucomicrobia bacterium]|nr:hypothetical protein [Verrucomicrobiota bacterium]